MTNDSDDTPLVDESTVELYRRVRREARLPARPDAEAVGALNELIAALRDANRLWLRAAEAASIEAGEAIEREAAAMSAEAKALCVAVRNFGGAPPTDTTPSEPLPFSGRDLDYASDDAAIEAGLRANHEKLRESRRRLAERNLPEEARALISQ